MYRNVPGHASSGTRSHRLAYPTKPFTWLSSGAANPAASSQVGPVDPLPPASTTRSAARRVVESDVSISTPVMRPGWLRKPVTRAVVIDTFGNARTRLRATCSSNARRTPYPTALESPRADQPYRPQPAPTFTWSNRTAPSCCVSSTKPGKNCSISSRPSFGMPWTCGDCGTPLRVAPLFGDHVAFDDRDVLAAFAEDTRGTDPGEARADDDGVLERHRASSVDEPTANDDGSS